MPRQSSHTPARRTSPRRAANVTVRPEYVTEARELGINLSEAFERGLTEAIARARAERWMEENREALDSYNRFVERDGLPLEDLRLF
ncbi:MAG TPA: type II toxin-antitoxin system CcdA family antitoxin [Allosphingosinicella sp.]|nr:type II toxin-antitoxin system CcdA family antitoxin [Allosphingosinicella sp.]